jgi:hypothetical protein
MAGAREVVISYGTWATNDTGFNLNGVHDISQNERTFRCEFDVVVVGASAAQVRTYTGTMITQLNERHLDFEITVGGTSYYKFVDGVDGAGSGEEGAEFIQATWELLGTHRTTKTRAYRITITVTRSAQQPGKFGVLDQGITLITRPSGQRLLTFTAQFTPGHSDSQTGTAQERYDDATYGFDALTTALTTALTGTWERTGVKGTRYDEDSRTLNAWATFTELIYDQSLNGRDEPALINVRYDISTERRAAPGIPEFVAPRPFTGVGVSFVATVPQSYLATGRTYKQAIEDKAIPYIRAVVAQELTTGTAVYLGHGLKADPVNGRIAGNVLFLVQESDVLEVSKRVIDQGFTGDVYVPVLDGTRWTRDRHTGPGTWTRRVILGVKVIGDDAQAASVLDQLSTADATLRASQGFRLLNWDLATESIVENFREPGGGSFTTTTQTRELLYVRAIPRGSGAQGARQSPTGHIEYGTSQGEFGGNA